jgi:diketogulonate reductase-like aldo/keto reductase
MVLYDEKDGMRRRRPYIASIGVSNFKIDDMRQLLDVARIHPHVYQGDSWTVFNDAEMMDLLTENEIFFQAYSVFGR